ncbi:MAG: FAD-dependent oxidoreductase [Bacteroidetes bacterium]|nr:FAD-dependent oxidoreductase [Bacteroidota bacterium]
MIFEADIRIPYRFIHDSAYIKTAVADFLELKESEITHIEVKKRSLDARKRDIKYNLKLAVYKDEKYVEQKHFFFPKPVDPEKKIVIIGCGPAGMFAALRALELGIKPVIFERGKDVRSRRRDLAKIHKEHIVNPDSNYCFGEGGAGTYSDGKLYTRSKKRGNTQKALEWFVHFGADKDILVNAHPHIGTNRLPGIIQAMRESIIAAGGEVHFESKLTDLRIENNRLKAIELNNQTWYECDQLILATGHSARDIFELLFERKIRIEAKPFALGVRIEHAQNLIDEIQYHGLHNDENLPPASYSLVTQVDGMGVYSFCMCPGGIVAPCATDAEEVVTNGWSPSKRNNPYSNSGMVVQIEPQHLMKDYQKNPFVCLDFQKEVEYACWVAGGRTQAVPAQRMIDFIQGKVSNDLPETSYQPGLKSVDLNTVLPPMIANRLKKAFTEWGKKMPGFLTNDAVLHAPESRTSSPVKIPRNDETLEHVETGGLYPCGEGAGYAGGIMSAAVDGMNCVEKIADKIAR